jgi:hypothetical protein
VLGLGQARLHDVADRDQPDQLAALHDGQMAEAAGGHHLHDLLDRGVGVAGHDIARHDVRRLERQGRRAVRGDGMDDVALRDDADHLLQPVDDQHRANAARAQLARDVANRCARGDRVNKTTLLRENIGDEHGSLLSR